MGKIGQPEVSWDYFKNLDSMTIVWDHLYQNTHMLSDTFFSTNNFVQFGEYRNIGSSYVNTISSETKSSIEWAVKYTLTEDDYLDAKN